jgi:hypothetical protein
MDQQRLRTLVFEKTGVKLDINDPVFAVVALNEAVLAEAVERHLARIDAASEALAAHALRAGGLPHRSGLADEFEPAHPDADLLSPAPLGASGTGGPSPSANATGWLERNRQAVVIAGGAALLAALLTLAGQALFLRPPAPPAPVVVAKELTPEQAQALRNAEKLERIVQKLDSKTRAAIQAEMALRQFSLEGRRWS